MADSPWVRRVSALVDNLVDLNRFLAVLAVARAAAPWPGYTAKELHAERCRFERAERTARHKLRTLLREKEAEAGGAR